jgi:site-specific DNA-methyltransferase (adenine-specific)
MANLSKIKREKMLDYLEKLKEINNDDENIRAITEIENALNEKKYGLVWEEHLEKVDEELVHNIPIFVEDENRKITVNEDEPYNFLLEGDNLHSLKLLEKTHKGKIDVIYIDPPYNTGNKDFIYDDSFVDKTDGYAHSKWLSFMEKRLLIAKELLSNNGAIFINIDDNE